MQHPWLHRLETGLLAGSGDALVEGLLGQRPAVEWPDAMAAENVLAFPTRHRLKDGERRLAQGNEMAPMVLGP
jgi:hypothetical protein